MGFGIGFYVFWMVLIYVGCVLGVFIGDLKFIGFDVLLLVYFFGFVMGFCKWLNWLLVVIVSLFVLIVVIKFVGLFWYVSIGVVVGIVVVVFMLLLVNMYFEIEEG